MLSFWEENTFNHVDIAIVGAGITGLSTAISIKERAPHLKVLILERGIMPTGASTRNAGFACFGSLSEILDDIENFGKEKAHQLVQWRWQGLQLLKKRLGTKKTDYRNWGGFELIRESETHFLDRLPEINDMMEDIFETKIFSEKKGLIKKFGFRNIETVVQNTLEGQVDTGKMMYEMMLLAQKLGVMIWTNCLISKWRNDGDEIRVGLQDDYRGGFSLHAKKLVLCTNAFTENLLPKADLLPGRGIVMITKPIEGLKIKGSFHLDRGYFYFRNFGKRLIVGGGRNLDKEGETTTDFGLNQKIMDDLQYKLKNIILPGRKVEIEQNWSGIMAFGHDKMPLIKTIADHVYVAVRMGGMGVAIGSLVGKRVGEMVLDEAPEMTEKT
ncbi:MAG TPA: FAD-dependent oxidoreductase [Cytophagales bacterium]|jgi:gamma-glutamylputrescine oxidase|nr:FAD-dependent oxidoreductase [Cytophagales bacterium]